MAKIRGSLAAIIRIYIQHNIIQYEALYNYSQRKVPEFHLVV